MSDKTAQRVVGFRCPEARKQGNDTLRCHEMRSFEPHTHQAWDREEFLHYWHTTPAADAKGLCRRCGWRPADGDGVCTICRTHADADLGAQS